MNGDPRYTGVALMLPDVLPAITRVQAVKVYNRLVRAFGGTEHIPVGVLENRGGCPIRSDYSHSKRGRACWASTEPTRSHFKGWGRIVHDASHYVFEKRHPSARPHDGGHAQLECQMAHYVVKHQLIERMAPKPPKRVKVDNSVKLAKTDAAIKRWQTKAKRAATALRKLNAKRKRILKTMENPQ
jgi:hypothetical protein